MATRRGAAGKGLNGTRGRRKPPRSAFKPGHNSQGGEVFRRGPDLVPRRQVQRGVLLKALSEQELRDVKSGKRVTGRAAQRRAALIRGAMLEDLAIGYRRVAYAVGHERGKKLQEALAIAAHLVKLGDHIAEHLDQKPQGPPRTTQFVFSGQAPNQEIPAEQGQRQLSPAEEGHVEIREEDVP